MSDSVVNSGDYQALGAFEIDGASLVTRTSLGFVFYFLSIATNITGNYDMIVMKNVTKIFQFFYVSALCTILPKVPNMRKPFYFCKTKILANGFKRQHVADIVENLSSLHPQPSEILIQFQIGNRAENINSHVMRRKHVPF